MIIEQSPVCAAISHVPRYSSGGFAHAKAGACRSSQYGDASPIPVAHAPLKVDADEYPDHTRAIRDDSSDNVEGGQQWAQMAKDTGGATLRRSPPALSFGWWDSNVTASVAHCSGSGLNRATPGELADQRSVHAVARHQLLVLTHSASSGSQFLAWRRTASPSNTTESSGPQACFGAASSMSRRPPESALRVTTKRFQSAS